MKNRLFTALVIGFIGTSSAQATQFFNASLIPNVALFKKTEKIVGVTLSIWGENETQGLALGLVNGMRGDSAGVGFGVLNYADSFTGAQAGIVNWSKTLVGAQVGAINFIQVGFTGVQFGGINFAERLRGVQIGLVNYAQTSDSGVQVGLVNIMPTTKTFFGGFPGSVAPVMLLANWRFN